MDCARSRLRLRRRQKRDIRNRPRRRCPAPRLLRHDHGRRRLDRRAEEDRRLAGLQQSVEGVCSRLRGPVR